MVDKIVSWESLPDFRKTRLTELRYWSFLQLLNQTFPELSAEERTIKIGRVFVEAGNERTHICISEFPKQCESIEFPREICDNSYTFSSNFLRDLSFSE